MIDSSPLVFLERPLGGVARLILNNPGTLNAMDPAMGEAFLGLIDELAVDDSVRVLILTGAGRAFSAGGNLKMLENNTQTATHEVAAMMETFYRRYLQIRELPFPTIAAINGFAVGAGLCIAMGCDIRLAARSAKMGVNFTKLGLGPGMGTTWSLPRLVGRSAALELILSGRLVAAEEAANIGLVNRVCDDDSLAEEALALAVEIAANAPIAVRLAKRLVYQNETASLEEALAREASAQAMTFATEDALIGVQAVRSKSQAAFQNR